MGVQRKILAKRKKNIEECLWLQTTQLFFFRIWLKTKFIKINLSFYKKYSCEKFHVTEFCPNCKNFSKKSEKLILQTKSISIQRIICTAIRAKISIVQFSLKVRSICKKVCNAIKFIGVVTKIEINYKAVGVMTTMRGHKVSPRVLFRPIDILIIWRQSKVVKRICYMIKILFCVQ